MISETDGSPPLEDGATYVPVKRDRLYGCALWQGKTDSKGYGRVGRRLAHHVVYEQEVGPIPKGKELDHLCRRRNCVEPQHLEPVTRAENNRRIRWKYRLRKLQKCPNGHDLRAHGRTTPEGGKVCRVCCGL